MSPSSPSDRVVVPGALTAKSTSLSFASVQVGTSQTLSETLTNTGGSDVTISQGTVTGSGFSLSGFSPPLTLTPGQYCTFSVTFAPQSAGSASGSISVVSSASNPNLTISLSGTATPDNQLAVSPTNLNFGRVLAGNSAQLSASLSATGSSVTVNSAEVSTSGFTLSGLSFPITIAAGQSVPFTVTFTPDSGGITNATLSFASNAADSPTVASLTGTGVIPPRTDVTFQAYPGSIPCPASATQSQPHGSTGCQNGGALRGANYYFTPSDFPSTPMLRVTDVNTYTTNSSKSFGTNCGGSAETNIMDSSDSVFYVCDFGSAIHIMTFNPATPSIAQRYTSYSVPGCGSGDAEGLFFSFTQALTAYSTCFNSSNNPVIGTFNFTSTSTGPTVANGGITTVVDLSTCVSALTGVGPSTYLDDVTVSADDQTFATLGSTTAGQGSGGVIYVIVWNRTLGCRVWNTSTNVISGSYGSSPTGSASFTSDGVSPVYTGPMTLHNVRLGLSGTWVKVTPQAGPPGTLAAYTWQINTLNVYEMWNDSTYGCGQTAIGYSNMVNTCDGQSHHQAEWERPNNSTGSYTLLPATLPPDVTTMWDTHLSWNNDNASDTKPFLLTSDNGQFAPVQAWDNEILGVATDGSGTVYRFGHHYGTNQSQFFDANNEIGNVSADGQYYIWTTDWDGMLGNTNGTDAACTIGTNCRADVFMAILP
jgi:Cep192 domain 4/Abnormal spindle-like microcephaly-assoc'd, ASPM-SPD-2-Hydin